MRTPWGVSQQQKKITHGMISVETHAHGGIHLSKTLNERIPEEVREATWNGKGKQGWYEEDEDAVLPYMFLWNEIVKANPDIGLKREFYHRWCLKVFPEIYEKYFQERESMSILELRVFMTIF